MRQKLISLTLLAALAACKSTVVEQKIYKKDTVSTKELVIDTTSWHETKKIDITQLTDSTFQIIIETNGTETKKRQSDRQHYQRQEQDSVSKDPITAQANKYKHQENRQNAKYTHKEKIKAVAVERWTEIRKIIMTVLLTVSGIATLAFLRKINFFKK